MFLTISIPKAIFSTIFSAIAISIFSKILYAIEIPIFVKNFAAILILIPIFLLSADILPINIS